MFNSREYEWADVTAIVGGKDIEGLRGVTYKRSKEKELVYGKGNEPIAIQSGNVSYEGELTMLRSDYQALKEAGKGTILDMQIDIVVSYGNPSRGDAMTTDKLLGVQFTEENDSMSQGDKYMEVSLPFIFLRKK